MLFGARPRPAAQGVGTTTSFDGAGYVFYQAGITGSTQGGLPATGTIQSAFNSTVTFQLQPYFTSNALFFSQASEATSILTLESPAAYQTVNLLFSSGGGGATFNFTLNFSDGSSVMASETSPDWYGGATMRSKALSESRKQAPSTPRNNPIPASTKSTTPSRLPTRRRLWNQSRSPKPMPTELSESSLSVVPFPRQPRFTPTMW